MRLSNFYADMKDVLTWTPEAVPGSRIRVSTVNKNMRNRILQLLCLITGVVFSISLHGQSVTDPGKPIKGKIRVHHEHIGYRDREGDEHKIGFRTFTVDSVQQPAMTFGNHYWRLKNVVKQDPEASIYLINATYWERSQRICIGATFVGLAVAAFVPMNQKAFNTTMYINLAGGGGILVCHLVKRFWANKSIKTWNAHLDEGKYRYQ